MKRGVNDANVFLHFINGILIYYLCFYMCNEFIIDRLSDDLIFACCNSILTAHSLHCRQISDRQYFCGNAFIMRRSKLCSILPVYFVSIVLWRIVAGSNIKTCDTAKLTYCK